jgi:hypothetical protein
VCDRSRSDCRIPKSIRTATGCTPARWFICCKHSSYTQTDTFKRCSTLMNRAAGFEFAPCSEARSSASSTCSYTNAGFDRIFIIMSFQCMMYGHGRHKCRSIQTIAIAARSSRTSVDRCHSWTVEQEERAHFQLKLLRASSRVRLHRDIDAWRGYRKSLQIHSSGRNRRKKVQGRGSVYVSGRAWEE